jgi:hypothetical protein
MERGNMKSMNKCAAVAVILRDKNEKFQTGKLKWNIAVFAFVSFRIGCKPILSNLCKELMGSQNIYSTFFSYCAVEFGTNIFSAVKIVWLVINFFP